MIDRRNIHRGGIEEQRSRKETLVFGNIRESVEPLRVHGRQAESTFSAGVEEDGVDDFTGRSRDTQAGTPDAKDSVDIRDLLLDETD